MNVCEYSLPLLVHVSLHLFRLMVKRSTVEDHKVVKRGMAILDAVCCSLKHRAETAKQRLQQPVK